MTMTRRRAYWTTAITLIIALALATSTGLIPRVHMLIANSRTTSLTLFSAIWGISLLALIIAAAQPNKMVRWFWALVLSASLALSQLYHAISGSEFTVYDILSLWSARHEAGRALQQFHSELAWPLCLFAISFAVMAAFPVPRLKPVRWALTLACWAPLVPIGLIAGVLSLKNGSGAQALPQQFAPLAVSAVSLSKIAGQATRPRLKVTVGPKGSRAVSNIVMLVDESVRGDYLDFSPGNPFTPALAAYGDRLINFGPAASAGNCSHYTNALLRLGGSARDTATSVARNPAIWQYAKRAGYRTVYIDAQATSNKAAGRLQNFMTVAETRHIDRFVSFDTSDHASLDFRLLKVVKEELARGEPVFIYGNKNGAHFPYDEGYPKARARFGKKKALTRKAAAADLITSYRNNIAWTVDQFFEDLITGARFKDTLVLYTSDHGQNFTPGRHMHCSVKNADPREGLVPMLALTDAPKLRKRLKAAAKANWAATSHFQITPSLLTVMGYDQAMIAHRYGASLFDQAPGPARFSSGDIFGLFTSTIHWNEIDLTRNYLEADAEALGKKVVEVRE